MIRPKCGEVLVKVDPPQMVSAGGISIPQRRLSPEEIQERNHSPKAPDAVTGTVLAVGPWKRLENGLALPPPFPAGAKIAFRPGSGKDLHYESNDRFKLLNWSNDVLAVLTETS